MNVRKEAIDKLGAMLNEKLGEAQLKLYRNRSTIRQLANEQRVLKASLSEIGALIRALNVKRAADMRHLV